MLDSSSRMERNAIRVHDPECAADYREINRSAYDALASEYAERRKQDGVTDRRLISPFVRGIRKQFSVGRPRILDVGCGNGLNLAMCAQNGLRVTGIDISSRMLLVAHDSCPSARLIHGDFLTHPFVRNSYHGVLAKATIHLFPKEDALRLLEKVYLILKRKGMFYVATTIEPEPFEGLREKVDYRQRIFRYRRTWHEEELRGAVTNAGFRVTKTNYNKELLRNKRWVSIWAVKSGP